MLKKIILAPYYIVLLMRHYLYDRGWIKSVRAEVPVISIGNVSVGGTGKTPHVEMVIRMLHESDIWNQSNIAVLSRGYRRRSKGFRLVTMGGNADTFGDEPLQIKKKFPYVTVAVDRDRVQACSYLVHPETIPSRRRALGHIETVLPSDLIVLDDGLQYRKLVPALSVVLVDYNRPVTEDVLLPFGRLRDLPRRLYSADVIIVSKCPFELTETEKVEFAARIGFPQYDPDKCEGTMQDGRKKTVLFTLIRYDASKPVYENSDPHYVYAQKVILFSGIAKGGQLLAHMSDRYRILRNVKFPDHHRYTRSDFKEIERIVRKNPTAAVATTEKDAQRILDVSSISNEIRKRLFMVPIHSEFITEGERRCFMNLLNSIGHVK